MSLLFAVLVSLPPRAPAPIATPRSALAYPLSVVQRLAIAGFEP